MADAERLSALTFESVEIRNFRNLRALDFRPSSRLNFITGDNGQGKTSLLEALYAVATTRSFRTEKLAQALQTGAELARVTAHVREDKFERTLALRFGSRSRSVELDGKKPRTLASYAVRTPVVVFHPRDLELVSGGATERRRLLDRLMLYEDPTGAEAARRYAQALRERQRLLEERGMNAVELGDYERVLAEHGARFTVARSNAAKRLLPELSAAFTEVAPAELRLEASYVAGGSEDIEVFTAELRTRRIEDARRGRASFGPQRDDVALSVAGRTARSDASQGQQRLLSLSLKLAELRCIEASRRARPVLLLDDVSSELDRGRIDSVLSWLGGSKGQVFVTTTRPELFQTADLRGSERADFVVRNGALIAA